MTETNAEYAGVAATLEPRIMGPTFGSVFSGIGGLDLGLERAGMRCIWQSEIDPYACRVLAKHWPHVPNLGDVTNIDWSTVERPDLICGGYPCQPFSVAGRRAGVEDPRHLWPHFADALRVLRPSFAVLENVPGHLANGFGQVLGELAELGFDAEWEVLPAAAFGAPHLRYRVLVVAYAQRPEWRSDDDARGRDGEGQDGSGQASGRTGERREGLDDALRGRHGASDFSVLAGRDGPVNAGWWEVEPDVGRVVDGFPSRVDRLRGLGNAVVPQVAEWIGGRILTALSGQTNRPHFDSPEGDS